MCQICNTGIRQLSLPNIKAGDVLTFTGSGLTCKTRVQRVSWQRNQEALELRVFERDGQPVDTLWRVLGTYISKPATSGLEHAVANFMAASIGVGYSGATAYMLYVEEPFNPTSPQMGVLLVEQIAYPRHNDIAVLKAE